MTTARFEVVHTGPYKFHARLIAANGEPTWWTENYRTRRGAIEAVALLKATAQEAVEIRGVDER